MVQYPTHKSYSIAYKQCLWLSIAAITFTIFWCVWLGIQFYFAIEDPECIQWQNGVKYAQTCVVGLYFILPLILLYRYRRLDRTV